MIFITLIKWKQVPEKELAAQGTKMIEDLEKQGIKINWYWTLGRYDAVGIIEAPTEKEAMKILIGLQEWVETETLVAVPREEGLKLL